MNFLAHFYLAGQDPAWIVGHFLADHIRGSKFEGLPEGIIKGIRHHREVDVFTDNHPAHKEARDLIRPVVGRYSGVVVDVLYDHFLAKSWDLHHPEPLELFSNRIYQILQTSIHLEGKPTWVLQHMEAQNWLCLYREISGIDRVMRGMHKRVGGENSMDKSADVLVQEYQTLEATFQAFWPELQLFAEESRAQLLQ